MALGNSSACCRAHCFALGGELHGGMERRTLHKQLSSCARLRGDG